MPDQTPTGASSAAAPAAAAYGRVLLKMSGESFCRSGESGISMVEVASISEQIRRVVETGVQLAIVCGGGNILRGKNFAAVSHSINAPTAHYMGMLATVINGLALQDALENAGVPTRLQSAIRMEGVAEPFIRRRCVRHLEKGRVVILAAGTGSPFVTTDTAAALRAREIDADVVLNTSLSEGAAPTILEAGILGRPVIASDVPGNRELIRHKETGLLFQNEDEMAKQILALCRNRSAAGSLGVRIREDFGRRFDVEREIRSLLSAYAAA